MKAGEAHERSLMDAIGARVTNAHEVTDVAAIDMLKSGSESAARRALDELGRSLPRRG